MKKKTLLLTATITIILLLTACGSNNSNETSSSWPWMKASGEKQILVLPIYFNDVSEKIVAHAQREQIYHEAIADINAYIAKKQTEYLGNQVMHFNFILGSPLRANNVNDYFDDRNKTLALVNNPEKYDIVMAIFYTKAYCINSHAVPNLVVSCQIPEAVTPVDFSDLGIRHSQRNLYTALYLHELLHEFGMSDADNNQGKKECYAGESFDGTQQLSAEICTDSLLYQKLEGNIGQFQKIDDFIAQEIGWKK